MGPKKVEVIGGAFGWGAQLHATQDGPETLSQSGLVSGLWRCIVGAPIKYGVISKLDYLKSVEQLEEFSHNISNEVQASLRENHFPIVVGGDHTCAIGTWGAAADVYKGDLGLIWIDAHMDAHLPETSPSHALHGMPVAVLLGHGEDKLLKLREVAFKPEQIVLIGVRSYEESEARFLKSLNVKVFFMNDVRDRGFESVLNEAIAYLSQSAQHFGMSLDLDAFDPDVAPGVGSPVANGLNADEVCEAFAKIKNESNLIALEIAEFNPLRDEENKTLRLIQRVILSMS